MIVKKDRPLLHLINDFRQITHSLTALSVRWTQISKNETFSLISVPHKTSNGDHVIDPRS